MSDDDKGTYARTLNEAAIVSDGDEVKTQFVGVAMSADERQKHDDAYREKFRVEARIAAHDALDQWFDEVERERPDLGMGEQASIRFRGGYGEGYMLCLTCKRSMEREFG